MNKPVAYGMLTFCKNCGEQNPYAVKELTDEEIAEIYKSIHGWDVKIGDKNWIGLARELLRKAQEK